MGGVFGEIIQGMIENAVYVNAPDPKGRLQRKMKQWSENKRIPIRMRCRLIAP